MYAPGNSPGIVTAAAVNFDNTPVTSGAPTLQIELAGTTPGTQYDQLAVTGQASLGGTLALLPVNGFVPVAGDKFMVMTYSNRSGTFSSVTGTTPAPGLTYSAVYLPTSLVILTTTMATRPGESIASGNSSLGSNWIGGVAPGGIGDTADVLDDHHGPADRDGRRRHDRRHAQVRQPEQLHDRRPAHAHAASGRRRPPPRSTSPAFTATVRTRSPRRSRWRAI